MPVKLSYTNKAYKQGDLRKLIEKRVRKDLRTHKLLNTQQKYYLLDDKSVFVKLLCELLDTIFSNRLYYELTDKPPQKCLLIAPYPLEVYVSRRFEEFLSFKKPSHIICPIRTVSVEDASILLNTQLSAQKYLHPLLLSLQKHQPSSSFSLLNCFEELENK